MSRACSTFVATRTSCCANPDPKDPYRQGTKTQGSRTRAFPGKGSPQPEVVAKERVSGEVSGPRIHSIGASITYHMG